MLIVCLFLTFLGYFAQVGVLVEGSIQVGPFHTCVISIEFDSIPFCAGAGQYNQLGNSIAVTARGTFEAVAVSDVRVVRVGRWSSYFLKTNGQLYAAGATIGALQLWESNVIDVASSHVRFFSTCVLVSSPNRVRCVGENYKGMFGNGGTTSPTSLTDSTTVPYLQYPSRIIMGAGHTCIFASSVSQLVNSIYCAGDNTYGQLGNGAIGGQSNFFIRSNSLGAQGSELVDASGFGWHSCYTISVPGETLLIQMYCWGLNTDLRFSPSGVNGAVHSPIFIVSWNEYYGAVIASTTNTCYHIGYGGTRCIGKNDHGQFGSGTMSATVNTAYQTSTMLVDTLGTFPIPQSGISLAGSYQTTCIYLFRKLIKCAGSEEYGQFASGASTSSTNYLSVPVTYTLTTKSPTALPTRSPTVSRPTASPTSSTPTNSPVIAAPSTSPIFISRSFTGFEDQPVLLNDTILADQRLSSYPLHGQVFYSNASIIPLLAHIELNSYYQASEQDAYGDPFDSFTVSKGYGDSLVSITIFPVNDAPSGTIHPSPLVILANTTSVFDMSPVDVDSQLLSLEIVSFSSGVNVTLITSLRLRVTSLEDAVSNETLILRTFDGELHSSEITVPIQVRPSFQLCEGTCLAYIDERAGPHFIAFPYQDFTGSREPTVTLEETPALGNASVSGRWLIYTPYVYPFEGETIRYSAIVGSSQPQESSFSILPALQITPSDTHFFSPRPNVLTQVLPNVTAESYGDLGPIGVRVSVANGAEGNANLLESFSSVDFDICESLDFTCEDVLFWSDNHSQVFEALEQVHFRSLALVANETQFVRFGIYYPYQAGSSLRPMQANLTRLIAVHTNYTRSDVLAPDVATVLVNTLVGVTSGALFVILFGCYLTCSSLRLVCNRLSKVRSE